METEERMEALELRGGTSGAGWNGAGIQGTYGGFIGQSFSNGGVGGANQGFSGSGTTALMEVLVVALEQGCIPITKPSAEVAVDIPVVVVEVAVWVPVVEVETSTRAPMFHLL